MLTNHCRHTHVASSLLETKQEDAINPLGLHLMYKVDFGSFSREPNIQIQPDREWGRRRGLRKEGHDQGSDSQNKCVLAMRSPERLKSAGLTHMPPPRALEFEGRLFNKSELNLFPYKNRNYQNLPCGGLCKSGLGDSQVIPIQDKHILSQSRPVPARSSQG